MHPTLLVFGLIFLEPKGYQFESQKREFPMPGRQENERLAIIIESKMLPEQLFIDESSIFAGFHSRAVVPQSEKYHAQYTRIHQHDCADPPEYGFTETQS